MNLVEAWGRDTARAAGTAALPPLMVLVAIALIAFGGGGVGGLDSLSQVAAGPGVPADGTAESVPDLFAFDDPQAASDRRDRTGRDGGRRQDVAGGVAESPAGDTTRSGSPRQREQNRSNPSAPRRTQPNGGTGEDGGVAPPIPRGGGPLRAPADTVGDLAHGVTDSAPAPGNSLGGGVVDSVTDAAGRIGSSPPG